VARSNALKRHTVSKLYRNCHYPIAQLLFAGVCMNRSFLILTKQ
jgi:hypothetical protein